MPRILIVDDEKSIRMTLREILEYENYEVEEAEDGTEGLKKLQEGSFDLAFCDIKMPKMDGLEMLSKAVETGIETQYIMISAHGTIDSAVDATKKGAFDFIQKPPDLNRLLLTVRNALEKGDLEKETKVLKKKVNKKWEIIGESEPIRQMKETIERVAPTDARVFITGPSGSGKELVAQALHSRSGRAKKPLIEVNCAAIPSELIESELFGHEKGAFTGAQKQRIGKFEQAHEGTLFLDEIGEMSLPAQSKVLRALQEHKIMRVGGNKDINIDVRVVAATNKNIQDEIEAGTFREDLYHRLSVIPLKVPSLKERREDIPLLVNKFLEDIAEDYGSQPKKIDPKAVEYLKELDWRGNIRELRNVVERIIILSGDTIKEEDVKTFALITQ